MGRHDKGEIYRRIYRAVRLPWPLKQRDLVYTEYTRFEERGGGGGEVLICSRSSKELNESTSDLSRNAGRMRADMKLAGYRLKSLDGGSKTEIVCIIYVELDGVFCVDYFYKLLAASYLKGVVDLIRGIDDEIGDGGGGATGRPQNPMMTSITKGGGGVQNGNVNIELGRMIKHVVGETEDHKDENFAL